MSADPLPSGPRQSTLPGMGTIAIKDDNGLQAWLLERPEGSRQADGAAIAIRAALRVFPVWAGAMEEPWAREAGLSALPVLRQLLTAGVARREPSPELRAATFAATSVADAAFAPDAAFAAARSTAAAADAAFHATAAFAVNRAADAAVAEGAAPYTLMWERSSADATAIRDGADPCLQPLWDGPFPDGFNRLDRKTRAIWRGEPGVWGFWLRWWDGSLAGRPLDGALQRLVALIPDEVWKLGPAAVAEATAAIEAGRGS